jgi:hypothetical protein
LAQNVGSPIVGHRKYGGVYRLLPKLKFLPQKFPYISYTFTGKLDLTDLHLLDVYLVDVCRVYDIALAPCRLGVTRYPYWHKNWLKISESGIQYFAW